jgi:hypothetical protein
MCTVGNHATTGNVVMHLYTGSQLGWQMVNLTDVPG